MKDEHIDGYISRITLPNGKTYALRMEVVEVYPVKCKNCGATFELKYGSGRCECCGTNYTTQFKVVEA